jgi:nucleoside-diphosphate-sugar epimerase
MIKNKKIIITGGLGFIGSHLVERLSEYNDVTIIDDASSGSEVYGLSTISLRYFNVFGPRQNPNSQYAAVIPKFITSILRGEPPIVYGDGEQSRDFTFVRHVMDANILAISPLKPVI